MFGILRILDKILIILRLPIGIIQIPRINSINSNNCNWELLEFLELILRIPIIPIGIIPIIRIHSNNLNNSILNYSN